MSMSPDERHQATARAIADILAAHSSEVDLRIARLERQIAEMRRQEERRQVRALWRQLRSELRAEWDNLAKP